MKPSLMIIVISIVLFLGCKKDEIDTTGGIKVVKRITAQALDGYGNRDNDAYIDSIIITSPSKISIKIQGGDKLEFISFTETFPDYYQYNNYRLPTTTKYTVLISNLTSTQPVRYDVSGF